MGRPVRKAHLAGEIPAWDPRICIHATSARWLPARRIRAKVIPPTFWPARRPASWPTIQPLSSMDSSTTIQVRPRTEPGAAVRGGLPARTRPTPAQGHQRPRSGRGASRADNYTFFLGLPEADRTRMKIDLKSSQFLQPLFEYRGPARVAARHPTEALDPALGDRALIAKPPAAPPSTAATAHHPTDERHGRGPAWANSLSRTTRSSASASASRGRAARPRPAPGARSRRPHRRGAGHRVAGCDRPARRAWPSSGCVCAS